MKYSYMTGSRQHLACSFMPTCVRCRTLVDTNVMLYVLCCSVQGRLKAVLLCLGFVDTVAFGAWFVSSWCAQKKRQVRLKNKTPLCLCSPETMAGGADVKALTVSLQEKCLPSSHVHLAVGTPQCHDLG